MIKFCKVISKVSSLVVTKHFFISNKEHFQRNIGNKKHGQRCTFEFRAGSIFPVPVCTVSPRHWVNKSDTQ